MASNTKDSSLGFQHEFRSFATDAIHADQQAEQWKSTISLSTTFKQFGPGKHAGFEYSRSGNPTRNCLEKAVAALDGAKHYLCRSVIKVYGIWTTLEMLKKFPKTLLSYRLRCKGEVTTKAGSGEAIVYAHIYVSFIRSKQTAITVTDL